MSNQENYQLIDVWKKLSFVLMGLILITSGLSACASQAGADQPRATEPAGSNVQDSVDSDLANTKWRLISFGALGLETSVLEGSTITIEFDSEGQVGGTGGCNSYGAQYEVQGIVLSFREITHTMMACGQEGVGQQEQSYLLALESADSFALSEDRLTIWYNAGQGVLNWVQDGE